MKLDKQISCAFQIFLICCNVASSEKVLLQTENRGEYGKLLDPFGFLSHEMSMNNVGGMLQNGASTINQEFSKRMGQVKYGFEEAGKVAKIVGEDLTSSVSHLVSNHLNPNSNDPFGRKSQTGTDDRKREGLMTSLLRMIGLDTSQLALMALNVLIFVAEMITTSIMGGDINEIPYSRSSSSSTDNFFLTQIFDYNSKRLDELLSEAQDPALPRTMIERIAKSTGNRSPCIQLLVCKASPLIWSIQRSMKVSIQSTSRAFDPDVPQKNILQNLYDALPDLNDFLQFSSECENQFARCSLIGFADLKL